ncbi:MAG: tRNA (N6-threonylcarbamoyladenosine(37)-N6)-methyltransferase TrmO [Halothiobacillus sp. 24-54-40]|jgi:tRNA-Thr(GGU) m(6)t(6)A37 methyltransferase TsaA|nr:MAG: tRNA (N6-threonylcarbamoyladenosine(37)-N6)-methyltransferase TrmO [Halothiobacillus sp. 35-54-62]OYZ85390.1 MAG: tRNA (N6-threonylcarbamoyladenosine(37)-N6)-methyltransferase TrmO [Halothiobacillus sp. 24-54-40]OZA80270.1 MAG: tRNA (N6-threonylcarbamoyladenosine(37)-N6)-methyltransferase TrmO [Halothiobacillus sp. 39-53-45]HQS03357.1 tRNA (N6-threonylcarbamoyladenosine(37)-N6)-methyltransferase TrmO [Halothiobacillus sp.]HQS28561.1 tRNA (N6-threonylcarbamoyladenosine(37)-N6)-methyltran
MNQPSNAALQVQAIAIARSPFKSRFGTPRQSGLVADALGVIQPIKPWHRQEAWVGIEQYSHLWLIWQVHDNPHQPASSVRPPRLGGNVKLGVFATRSPARPNPIGLSLVKLQRVESRNGHVLIHVSGLDLLDGTPILDIKPHIAFTDCPKNSDSGMAREEPIRLPVDWTQVPPAERESISAIEKIVIEQTLALDPRPAFHDDPERVYHCPLFGWNVRFKVQEGVIIVMRLDALSPNAQPNQAPSPNHTGR